MTKKNNDLKQLSIDFDLDLASCNKEIKKNVSSILIKLKEGGMNKDEILSSLLKYKEYNWFSKNVLVDLLIFKYEDKHYCYPLKKEREKLLKYLSPCQIMDLEDAEKDFYKFCLETLCEKGKKRINRKRLAKILNYFSTLPTDYEPKETIELLKISTKKVWYSVTDAEFQSIFNEFSEVTGKLSPKVIKGILKEHK